MLSSAHHVLVTKFCVHPIRRNEKTMFVNVVPHTNKGADGIFNYNLELESIISYSQNLINPLKKLKEYQ